MKKIMQIATLLVAMTMVLGSCKKEPKTPQQERLDYLEDSTWDVWSVIPIPGESGEKTHKDGSVFSFKVYSLEKKVTLLGEEITVHGETIVLTSQLEYNGKVVREAGEKKTYFFIKENGLDMVQYSVEKDEDGKEKLMNGTLRMIILNQDEWMIDMESSKLKFVRRK